MSKSVKKIIALSAASSLLAGLPLQAAADTSRTLIISSGQSAGTMDPVQAYDGWYPVRYGICQTLTKMNDDLTISGWLAEDGWSSNEDHTEWTFVINDSACFSNGNKLTAELVKESLENVFKNGTRGPEYFTPASIEADGQTLVIRTEKPEPILPNKLADPLFCIIDTTVDNSNIADDGPVGTGPFVMESFDPVTKECIVTRNENYWNGDVACGRIDFIYTEDQSVLTMGLQAGDFDAVYNVSMTDVPSFEADSAYTVVKNPSGRTAHGFMNENGLLGDITLRQAILQSLDRESYCQNLLNGQYVAGKTLVTSAADYGYDELTDPNAYDPEHAAQILDEAGYKDIDNDGFRETPDGKPIDLHFIYYTGRPEQQIMVEATQTALSEIGIRITPDVHDTQTVIDLLASGEFDLLCMSINVMNCADPENHLNTYFRSGGSYQAYGYDNGEFNALLDTLSVTADPEARRDIVKKAEQILLDDAVCIFFCYPVMNFVMRENVTGILSTPADYYWVDENTAIR